MYRSVYDIKGFYNSRIGRVVRRVLQERIREIWPETKGLRVAGCGYAVPYLRMFAGESERVFALMPAALGAHPWPQGHSAEERNLVCLAEESELPLETGSIDRLLLVHDMEFSEHLKPHLQEAWRILKPNGRMLVIVANRGGFWARADWSPLGQGTPYSAAQIHNYLRDNMFIHERTEEALFMPPVRWSWILKSAGFCEEIGRAFLPMAAGVHMVEATKQIYAARTDKGSGVRVVVRGRGYVPQPVPQGFSIL